MHLINNMETTLLCFFRRLLALSFLVLSINACSPSEQSDVGASRTLSLFEVDNSRIDFLSVLAGSVKADTIVVSKELSYKIGSDFSEFFPLEDNLLLVDRDASDINCIDPNGNHLWNLIPPSPGVDRYIVIGAVDIDKENEEVYVEDRLHRQIDVFDYGGAYLRSIRSEVSFMEFAVLGKDKIIYDVAEIDQSINEGFSKQSRFLYAEGEKNVYFSPLIGEIGLDAIPVNNGNRFSMVANDGLQHRMPFGDTIYSIGLDLEPTPIASFSFKQGNEFVSLAKDPKVKDVWEELHKEGLPEPYSAVYEPGIDKFYCNFWKGGSLYFAYINEGRQAIYPSKFYRLGGVVVKSPRYYAEGRFYQQMFRYEYEYLQKAFEEEFEEEKILSDLSKLENTIGDNDDIFIISTEFK